jgi:hypothetical protein
MFMATHMKVLAAVGVVALIGFVTMGRPASAITVEVAKTCRDMMVKKYPPQVAGSSKGNALEQREYYKTCIAKGGGKADDKGSPTEGRGK